MCFISFLAFGGFITLGKCWVKFVVPNSGYFYFHNGLDRLLFLLFCMDVLQCQHDTFTEKSATVA